MNQDTLTRRQAVLAALVERALERQLAPGRSRNAPGGVHRPDAPKVVGPPGDGRDDARLRRDAA